MPLGSKFVVCGALKGDFFLTGQVYFKVLALERVKNPIGSKEDVFAFVFLAWMFSTFSSPRSDRVLL